MERTYDIIPQFNINGDTIGYGITIKEGDTIIANLTTDLHGYPCMTMFSVKNVFDSIAFFDKFEKCEITFSNKGEDNITNITTSCAVRNSKTENYNELVLFHKEGVDAVKDNLYKYNEMTASIRIESDFSFIKLNEEDIEQIRTFYNNMEYLNKGIDVNSIKELIELNNLNTKEN